MSFGSVTSKKTIHLFCFLIHKNHRSNINWYESKDILVCVREKVKSTVCWQKKGMCIKKSCCYHIRFVWLGGKVKERRARAFNLSKNKCTKLMIPMHINYYMYI